MRDTWVERVASSFPRTLKELLTRSALHFQPFRSSLLQVKAKNDD